MLSSWYRTCAAALARRSARVHPTPSRKSVCPRLEVLEDRCVPAVTLVKDINTTFTASASPRDFVTLNGTVFFLAEDATGGYELWKSDGTSAGTVPVTDFATRTASGIVSRLAVFQDHVYFGTFDPNTGQPGLYRTDGTTLVRISEVIPTNFMPLGTTLFFADGDRLWKTDGTTAGTVVVKAFVRKDPYTPPGPFGLIALGSTLFFSADDGVAGRELWKSDGTTAGTVIVRDINTNGESSPEGFVASGGHLFFSADDGVSGRELWRSDGTAAGTFRVKDIRPGLSTSDLGELTDVNGTLFFRANDGSHDHELWKSNGTEGGTVLVAGFDGFPGSGSFPSQLTVVGSTVYFTASDGINGTELWKSDGTAAGTTFVKDINPGSGNSMREFSLRMCNVNGTLFFGADDGTNGLELWKSDGTAAGTTLVKDLFPGARGGLELAFFGAGVVNNTLFFVANDGMTGFEVWKSDGTTAGTMLVKNINLRSDSNPSNFVDLNGTMFFSASDGTGAELWKSDGTAAGTTLVRDISAEPVGSFPRDLTVVGSTLYFVGDYRLWKSDGTAVGTVEVNTTGNSLYSVTEAVNFNGTLFFAGSSNTNSGLWKTDGTAAGTVPVKHIYSGAGYSEVSDLVVIGSTLYFVANDGVSGRELWKSDGTTAGTGVVKDIAPGSASALGGFGQDRFAVVGSLLYFTASDGVNGTELWKSDGTAAGTQLVKNINTTSMTGSFPDNLTPVGTTLFFTADNGVNGKELWKTDGTDTGTVLVTDLWPGAASGLRIHFGPFGALNGTLFFPGFSPMAHGIFKTDGTAAGTTLFRNDVTTLDAPIVLNNLLYFRGESLETGAELWRTDGTTAGTFLLGDLNPGPANGRPLSAEPALGLSNGKLFFVGDDGTIQGTELYALDPNAADILVSPLTGLVTSEDGGTDTFSVVLTTSPTVSVTIPVSSSDTTEGMLSASSVTFTPANWNVPQVIMVTGVNDAAPDGAINYTIITAAAVSGDARYNGLNPVDIGATNFESPGITVSPTTALTTTEAGGTTTFTIVLNTQPTGNVTIGVSSSDTTEGTVSVANLVFTTANWNVPQTVTVTGIDDAGADGNVAYTIITAAAGSTDPNYNGLNPADVPVTNTDNDVSGITVSPTTALTTTEAGGTTTFTVVLNTQPTGNVTIGVSSSDTTEGTVSVASLVFTTANWNVPQTVTVTGVDDLPSDGTMAYTIRTATAISSDPAYNGLNAADVSVTNTDNDFVGITVSPTGLVTTEAGGTAQFTVVLNTQPTANVTIGLSSSDTTEGTVSAANLVFTTVNWNVPQVVTVTGVDDPLDDDNFLYTIITATTVSSDPAYNGLNPVDVLVINTDNDVSGITVTPTAGLTTTEAGGTAQFNVVLHTQPTANVTIGLSSSDATEGTVSAASLVFTPANWNVPQAVTVTGVDDLVADGNVAYTILTAAANSTDPGYNGRNAVDVAVVNQDVEGPLSLSGADAVSAAVVPKPVGKNKKLVAQVTLSDGTSRQIMSPYQKPKYLGIRVSLQDLDGDGTFDAVLFSARRGKKRFSRLISL